MLVLIFAIVMLVVLVDIFWLVNLIYAQIFGAPTVYSSVKAVKDALNLAGLKKGQTIVDLGCGDARALIIASREFGANGIGIERSPFCFLKSKINVYLSGQKNIRIFFGNFKKFESEIGEADLIYLYLLNSVLRKMESWIFSILGKGAKIVSLSFYFVDHGAVDQMETRTLHRPTKIFLYKK